MSSHETPKPLAIQVLKERRRSSNDAGVSLIHPDNAIDCSKRVTVQIVRASRSDELKVIVIGIVSLLVMLTLLRDNFVLVLYQRLRLLGLELLYCLRERNAQDLASPAWAVWSIVRVGDFGVRLWSRGGFPDVFVG